MMRTRYCGLFRPEHVGERAAVAGWVDTVRDMGGVVFLDVRDREGVMQVVCDQSALPAEMFELAGHVRAESVVRAGGVVRLRDQETVNPLIPTGTVELYASSLTLLSRADPTPFPLEDAAHVREELRLRFRYLDLRRPEMFEALRFRARLVEAAEEFLNRRGFLQVETPVLTKSTPEGARDYLVPSRVHPGAFYALPQSPQIFKQLLMVGSIDRYYQVARCFRDEDLRADRQPEFTQVDMEMSFVTQEDVLAHLEELFSHLFERMMGRKLGYAFPRLTWQQAMDLYGTDKPDTRFGMEIVDMTDLMRDCSFSVFRKCVEGGGVVRAINAKGGEAFPRAVIDQLGADAVRFGAKGMAWLALRGDGSVNSILPKYFSEETFAAILARAGAEKGDLILFCADKLDVARRVLGQLRLRVADLLNLRDPQKFNFLFVTDFPEFEFSEEENRFVAMHHPFTMPYEEDLPYLESDPARVRAQAYDAVLNGVELGSGSVRIHDREVQRRMFQALGFSAEQIQARFGFMIDAFRYGTPPHAGFAFGLDRLAMLLLGRGSLRDVVAFPKLRDGSCPLTGAPDFVDEEQLKVLKLIQPEIEAHIRRRAPAGDGVDLERLAELSRLTLTGAEKQTLARDMRAIVDFAGEIAALDIEDVEPMRYPGDPVNVLREDVAAPPFPRDELLSGASVREGMVRVPRTF